MNRLLLITCLLCFAACTRTNRQAATTKTGMQTNNSHCKPKTTDKDWYSANTKAPVFKGLEGIDFKISTSKAEAQKYFNQGMMLSYGFNHAEAARSFYQAARIDSTCAMCWWGFAYVLGPNYNGGMEPDNFQRAYDAVLKAKSLAAGGTEKEKMLIEALTHRYVAAPPEDRSALDASYSNAMKEVYSRYPHDPDVGALYAESLMDMHPWDLYEKRTKKAKPWTAFITTTLEKLIRENPNHPGAHHFYIHAVEASEKPERGLVSAKLLATLVPGAGHLVHMPSHIYINTGDYYLGSLANLAAVQVDSIYTTACHAQGAYPLAYYPHNYHFLAATATLAGQSELAWMAAMKVQENTATEIMEEPGWGTLQHYYTIPYNIAVKFEMWDTLLNLPKPSSTLIYPICVWHYARGMAYAAKGNLIKAEEELTELALLSEDSTLKTLTIWNINSTYDLMQIALRILSADALRLKQQNDKAITLLREAVEIEDRLNYDEPPDWFFSVRHHLGMVLLQAGKYNEAENIYMQDLETFRENGWALHGLYTALKKQDKEKEASGVKQRFDKAWAHADFQLPAL